MPNVRGADAQQTGVVKGEQTRYGCGSARAGNLGQTPDRCLECGAPTVDRETFIAMHEHEVELHDPDPKFITER